MSSSPFDHFSEGHFCFIVSLQDCLQMHDRPRNASSKNCWRWPLRLQF